MECTFFHSTLWGRCLCSVEIWICKILKLHSQKSSEFWSLVIFGIEKVSWKCFYPLTKLWPIRLCRQWQRCVLSRGRSRCSKWDRLKIPSLLSKWLLLIGRRDIPAGFCSADSAKWTGALLLDRESVGPEVVRPKPELSHAVREKHWAVVLQCNTWKCQIDFSLRYRTVLYLLDGFVQYFLMHTFCIVITWPSFRLALWKNMLICA